MVPNNEDSVLELGNAIGILVTLPQSDTVADQAVSLHQALSFRSAIRRQSHTSGIKGARS